MSDPVQIAQNLADSERFMREHSIAMEVAAAGYTGVAEAIAEMWVRDSSIVSEFLRAGLSGWSQLRVKKWGAPPDSDTRPKMVPDTHIEWKADFGYVGSKKLTRVRGRFGMGDWIEVERILE